MKAPYLCIRRCFNRNDSEIDESGFVKVLILVCQDIRKKVLPVPKYILHAAFERAEVAASVVTYVRLLYHRMIMANPATHDAGKPSEHTAGPEESAEIGESKELREAAEEAEREKLRREREARAQALTLEIVGDLPYAEVKPPENVLFVCKLNPVTEGQLPHKFLLRHIAESCLLQMTT